MIHDYPRWRLGAAFAGSLALAACGGGGSGGDSPGSTGTLSLAVTDAPVDNVQQVWVQFTGVRVQPKSGEVIAFTFDTPKDIDLLALTGENSVTLLNNETVPAGEYNWIALKVNRASTAPSIPTWSTTAAAWWNCGCPAATSRACGW